MSEYANLKGKIIEAKHTIYIYKAACVSVRQCVTFCFVRPLPRKVEI